MAELTDKQKRFAEEYLIDLNATQAAIRAGYSEKTANEIGSQNLAKLDISEYINQKLEEISDKTIADVEEVMRYLTSVMRREHKESVVVTVKTHKSWYDKQGKRKIEDTEEAQIVEIPAKLSDSNKAAELLGKRYGLFTEKLKVDANIQSDKLTEILKQLEGD